MERIFKNKLKFGLKYCTKFSQNQKFSGKRQKLLVKDTWVSSCIITQFNQTKLACEQTFKYLVS